MFIVIACNALIIYSSSSKLVITLTKPLDKNEVFTRGKYKKYAATELLQEFENKIIIGVVVGCNCNGQIQGMIEYSNYESLQTCLPSHILFRVIAIFKKTLDASCNCIMSFMGGC